MKNRNGWHLFLRNELDFYPNRGIIGKHNADVAERQTRWFQVPVLRDVWVQIPSSAPKKDCNFDTKLQSFLTKSAYVGINPLSWMKSLRDEIPLTRGYGDADLISSEAEG